MTKKLTIYQPGGAYPDPHMWVEARSLQNIRFNVFEGLVRYDRDLNIVPALAESWKVSPDAKEWTFRIRENVRFHDGTLLTAADAAASIRNASRKDIPGALGTGSLMYGYLGGAMVEAADEMHVRINLPAPMADLPDLLVYIMITPEHSIGAEPESIPGTGPFRFGKVDSGRFVLFANEAYWGGAPDLEELIFVAEKDPSRRVEALLRGDADLITDLEGKHTAEVDAKGDYCVIEYDEPLSVALLLNCSSGPFTDVRVRQAVNFGTDQDEIIEKVCAGAALPLSGPLSRAHFGVDPRRKPYPYDTKRAWELLAEAGYAEGLTLTMYCPTVLPDESAALAKNLKQQWARIGIKLNIEVQENREQYALDVRDKKIHDLCVFDSSPLSTYRVLHEKLDSGCQGPWWQGYDSPAFNELLARAERTPDLNERRQLYREAIGLASEEAPWVFLYSPIRFFAASWDTVDDFPLIGQRADGLILVK